MQIHRHVRVPVLELNMGLNLIEPSPLENTVHPIRKVNSPSQAESQKSEKSVQLMQIGIGRCANNHLISCLALFMAQQQQ